MTADKNHFKNEILLLSIVSILKQSSLKDAFLQTLGTWESLKFHISENKCFEFALHSMLMKVNKSWSFLM